MPEPNTTFEVTTRTLQGRLLLRPSKELNRIILGILGKALERYPVLLHLVVVVSNHIHLIVTARDTKLLSRFMQYINSNIAREAGRLHFWREKLWGRRYSDIPILDDAKLLERVRYLLSHGCKEGLVLRPGDWPGVNCVKALCRGKKLFGTWYDRTKEYEARRAGIRCRSGEFATQHEVPLSPLPCHADLSPEEQRAFYRAMVKDIEKETLSRFGQGGRRVLGVKKVLAQKPHRRPNKIKRSPRPLCHCSDPERWKKHRDDYRWFVYLYRVASRKFRSGDLTVTFPEGSFPPARAFCGPAPPN
jgi:REP element-mobilizing transposase RayT